MKNKHQEYQYLELMQKVLNEGVMQTDAGSEVRTKSLFGSQIRFDLSKGEFPLLTTKKVFWKGVLHELIWFIKGDNNIQYLVKNGVHIWDDYPYRIYKEKVAREEEVELDKESFIQKIKEDDSFAQKHGVLEGIYGQSWRRWPDEKNNREVDQLQWIIDEVTKDPDAHNALVNSWNPSKKYSMAKEGEGLRFPICHNMFQINVKNGKLSLQLYQRSADMFLGVPFNIASYALLTIILAKITNNKPGEFIHTFGDYHIYEKHFLQVKEQLSREPKKFPKVKIKKDWKSIDEIEFEDFELVDYDSWPTIKAPLAAVGGVVTDEWKEYLKKKDLEN